MATWPRRTGDWTGPRWLGVSGGIGALALAALLGGCTLTDFMPLGSGGSSGSGPSMIAVVPANMTSRECLMRAMYFESNRSSREGMLAVGTVVMNRVAHPGFPKTVCEVVAAPRQFAAGVLTRPMTEPGGVVLAGSVADSLLAGQRHPKLHTAKFFHQAGLSFPYTNMHYVLEAGGNAFYEKRSRRR